MLCSASPPPSSSPLNRLSRSATPSASSCAGCSAPPRQCPVRSTPWTGVGSGTPAPRRPHPTRRPVRTGTRVRARGVPGAGRRKGPLGVDRDRGGVRRAHRGRPARCCFARGSDDGAPGERQAAARCTSDRVAELSRARRGESPPSAHRRCGRSREPPPWRATQAGRTVASRSTTPSTLARVSPRPGKHSPVTAPVARRSGTGLAAQRPVRSPTGTPCSSPPPDRGQGSGGGTSVVACDSLGYQAEVRSTKPHELAPRRLRWNLANVRRADWLSPGPSSRGGNEPEATAPTTWRVERTAVVPRPLSGLDGTTPTRPCGAGTPTRATGTPP